VASDFRAARAQGVSGKLVTDIILSSTLANFDWPDLPNLQVFRAPLEFLTVPGAPETVKKFARPRILQHFAHWRSQKLVKVELRNTQNRDSIEASVKFLYESGELGRWKKSSNPPGATG
jgi:hypothetical protein